MANKRSEVLSNIAAIFTIFAGIITGINFFFGQNETSPVIKSASPVILSEKNYDELKVVDISGNNTSIKKDSSTLSILILHNVGLNFKIPNFKVKIDEQVFENENVFNFPLASGNHEIEVQSENSITEKISLTLEKNKLYEIEVKLFPNQTFGYSLRKVYIWKTKITHCFGKLLLSQFYLYFTASYIFDFSN